MAGLLLVSTLFARPAPIALRDVKYSELCREVRELKGKVALVVFWADY